MFPRKAPSTLGFFLMTGALILYLGWLVGGDKLGCSDPPQKQEQPHGPLRHR